MKQLMLMALFMVLGVVLVSGLIVYTSSLNKRTQEAVRRQRITKDNKAILVVKESVKAEVAVAVWVVQLAVNPSEGNG